MAGFAAGNVMLLSIGIWAGEVGGLLHDMGPATRDLLHWVSALIAMPAIAYAGMPFFASAAAALRQVRTNMDVPISLGVILVTGMSLVQTMQGGAAHLLRFRHHAAVLPADRPRAGPSRPRPGPRHRRAVADAACLRRRGAAIRRQHRTSQPACHRARRSACWSVWVSGSASMASSNAAHRCWMPVSSPAKACRSPPRPARRYLPARSISAMPLTMRATVTGNGTLLAECARLIEAAEARRSRFVVLADRVARRYAPAVHVTALLTFLWWYFAAGVSVSQALLTASAVLIITCPCALALAVPVVQVIATGRLFRSGMLLKSPTALERLAECRYSRIRQDRHADRANDAAGSRARSRSGCVARCRIACRRQPPPAGAIAAGGIRTGRGGG